jgi:hypothetical protein
MATSLRRDDFLQVNAMLAQHVPHVENKYSYFNRTPISLGLHQYLDNY